MHVSRISYQRVVNLGNYQSERLEAEMTVSESDDPAEAVARLRAFVLGQLGLLRAELGEDAADDSADIPF